MIYAPSHIKKYVKLWMIRLLMHMKLAVVVVIMNT